MKFNPPQPLSNRSVIHQLVKAIGVGRAAPRADNGLGITACEDARPTLLCWFAKHLGNPLTGAVLLVVASNLLPASAADTALLDRWLAGQTNVQTWTAEFTQTRRLKTMVQPLVTPGRVWFKAPDQFRWELGQPAQTIAMRQSNVIWVAYPAMKRVEQYDLSAGAGSWKDALSLLETGFPRSRAELDERFQIAEIVRTNGAAHVTLTPRKTAVRRLIRSVAMGILVEKGGLDYTEMTFSDGSVMRNQFTNAVVNPMLPDDPFRPTWSSDFTVVTPMRPKSQP